MAKHKKNDDEWRTSEKNDLDNDIEQFSRIAGGVDSGYYIFSLVFATFLFY